jgi:hypothetical protein
MFKLVGAIALLIVVALVALAYLQLSPILTFVIVSVGLYLFARKGDGSLWHLSRTQGPIRRRQRSR